MQRIKNALLRNSGAITLGLGLANLWIWVWHDNDSFFLFLGLVMSGLGMLEWASDVEENNATK